MHTQQPPQHTHADAAAFSLRQALSAAHPALRDAVAAYKAASAGLKPDADLLDVLRAAGEVVLAAEAIVAAGKQLEAAARAALAATCMSDIGCPAVALADHVVHLSTKPTGSTSRIRRQSPPSSCGRLRLHQTRSRGRSADRQQRAALRIQREDFSMNDIARISGRPVIRKAERRKSKLRLALVGQRVLAKVSPRCSSHSDSGRRSA